MRLELLDYSDYCYKGTTLPPMQTGKFVSLQNGETMYIVLAPKGFFEYHADIVEKFCIDRDIDGYYKRSSYIFIITDNGWRITGGGRWRLDQIERTLLFFDNSKAYGKYDIDTISAALSSSNLFSGYKIDFN